MRFLLSPVITWHWLVQNALAFKAVCKRRRSTAQLFMSTIPTKKLRENGGKGVVLVNCGSFSPITLAHLMLMESAYNFALYSGLQILGGYLSPVHDSYGKRGLISSKQRLEMCQLAVEDSSWLMIDSWECSRSQYSPTFLVMEHFRSQLDQLYGDRVQLAFVCGSDLYCTLFNQDIWPKEHVERLLNTASLFVVPRTEEWSKSSAYRMLSAYLPGYQDRVCVLEEAPVCQISSTLVRDTIRKGGSIKYMVPDSVQVYITQHGLYYKKPSDNLAS